MAIFLPLNFKKNVIVPFTLLWTIQLMINKFGVRHVLKPRYYLKNVRGVSDTGVTVKQQIHVTLSTYES